MKIAVSAVSNTLDAIVDVRFGRCNYFIIVEVEKDKIRGFEAIQNSGATAVGGAGIQGAQIIIGKSVNVLITGNIGPNAFQILAQSGIKIVTGIGGISVKEAIQRYLKGELEETSTPTTPGFGPGRGLGPGIGRGR